MKAEKKHNKLRQAAGLLGSFGTAVSIAGGTVGATGVVIAGGSLIGVGALLGAGSLIALQLDKGIVKNMIKHDKLAALVKQNVFRSRMKLVKL